MFTGIDNKGQGLVEYALLFILVVLVILIVFLLFGQGVGNLYSNIVLNV